MVHIRYHRDKIGMSPDADRVPCNERLHPRSYRNTQDPDEDDKLVHLVRGCCTVEKESIKETSSDALCKLLQLQAAAEVDMEQSDGNPLNYHYFMALFVEVAERKIEEPRGRLTRLIKFTIGKARELIKHCIQVINMQEHLWKEPMVTLIRSYHHIGKKSRNSQHFQCLYFSGWFSHSFITFQLLALALEFVLFVTALQCLYF